MSPNRHRALYSALFAGALLFSGCGDDLGAGDNGGEADIAFSEDTAIFEAGSVDSGAVDAGENPDSSAPVDTFVAVDAGPEDTAKPSECPGGPECPCTDNSACDNGICIEVGGGKECARTCVDSCKEGYTCTPFSAGGADNVLICAPTWDWACDPCKESAQCKKVGLEAAVCVDYGDDGGYCGVPCSDESTCPVGYACKQVQSVEGAASKQCVRKGGEPLGLCTCSDAAKAKKLATDCQITHKDDKGQVTATCAGVRTCGDNGLSKCIGPAPSAEVCDGADNDCDGKTDEQACEDNNTCTADACDPTAAKDGKGGCKHTKLDGPCDADGSVCTEGDKCDGGVCVPGSFKDCDDGNTCTLDACDPAAGCTKTVDDGKACDGDGNPCTVGDTCKGGACAIGEPKNCASNDACVLAKCLPSTGTCAFSNKADKTPCDDGSLCTGEDACAGGFCKGVAVDCDDKNVCTVDSCDDKAGCAHKAVAASCDDGNACTTGDSCAAGKCVGLPMPASACDDGNPCTKDGCDPGTAQAKGEGCFVVNNNGAPCDDGKLCTGPGTCKSGSCVDGPYTCDCKSNADCVNKDDGNLCNGVMICDTSGALPVCKLNPATIVSCQKPEKPCISSDCAPATGQCELNAHKPGSSCDDGDACTVGDACAGTNATEASCAPGKKKTCDDGNACTVDSCDAKAGCQTSVDKTYTASCYSADPKTAGVGTCAKGERTCLADATLGPCKGEIVPAIAELCDGKDDDCDGATDEGCGTVGWSFRQISSRVGGTTSDGAVQLWQGGAVSGPATGAGARWMEWGLRAWQAAWSK